MTKLYWKEQFIKNMDRIKLRRKVDSSQERQMLIGLIISDNVCKSLIHIIDPNILQASYSARIIKWIKSYYSHYDKAPGRYIEDIFNQNKKDIEEAEATLISRLLESLSEEYETAKQFNSKYIIDKSLNYLTERALKTHKDNIDRCIETGKFKKAEAIIANYKKITQVTSKWINPFDPKQINATFENDGDKLFKLPGVLGDLIGWFEREYFVAIVAPSKRGKSWFLLELAVQSVINRFKVVFISLEMNDRRIKNRFYRNLSSSIENKTKIQYPCFDCFSNQIGDCDRRERTNSIQLIKDGDDPLPIHDEKMKYRPCTYCRTNDPSYYIPATWFEIDERQEFNLNTIRKKIKKTGKMYGDNKIRFLAYPRFSASITDLERDLDILEFTEEFIPDVIITDYIDIFKPSDNTGEYRHNIDQLWTHHARMASQRHALVITANQASKKSWDAQNVLASDSSENYRNSAHVDIMLTLNQKDEEKKMGVMRVAVVTHRDREFHQKDDVKILQQLSAGQILIDSERTKWR